jgi:hypothetical protein
MEEAAMQCGIEELQKNVEMSDLLLLHCPVSLRLTAVTSSYKRLEERAELETEVEKPTESLEVTAGEKQIQEDSERRECPVGAEDGESFGADANLKSLEGAQCGSGVRAGDQVG